MEEGGEKVHLKMDPILSKIFTLQYIMNIHIIQLWIHTQNKIISTSRFSCSAGQLEWYQA